MRPRNFTKTLSWHWMVVASFFVFAGSSEAELFPGSCQFYLHPGDFDCEFVALPCQTVQTATLSFLPHPDACTDVVADVYVDGTYVGSTGMLDGCQQSPSYDVTAFMADGSVQVSLRNPRCSPGYGCCGVADSTVATWGGYVFLQGAMTPTSVEESGRTTTTGFLTVHPNPPEGVLSYSITTERESRVTVQLFDAAGRLRATLLDERLERGRHPFASPLASGREVPAGIYFLRLQMGEQQQMQKVVILR